MLDDKNEKKVISLVWTEEEPASIGAAKFPENVLDDLQQHFEIAVCHQSAVSPLVLAELPPEDYRSLETFICGKYGPKLELGEFA